MDTLVSKMIKRAITSNIAKLDRAIPTYTFIKKGGGLLWNRYYRYVQYEYETLSEAHARLQAALTHDTIDTHYMNCYLDHFGPCWV